MVAVDGVDAEVDELGDVAGLLGVPTEGEHPEAVIEGGQTARPVVAPHVDGVYAGLGQVRGVALRPVRQTVETGGVDHLHLGCGRPPPAQHVSAVMADPETPSRSVSPGRGHQAVEGGGVLDIDAQRQAGATVLVVLVDGGNVRGQARPGRAPDGPAEEPSRRHRRQSPHGLVVVERDMAVRGDPGVGLDSGGTHPAGQQERFQRVLSGVGSCPAVSEGDGRAQ